MEAGFQDQTIVFWLQAGQRALNRSAYAEAITHFRQVLELLKGLPETPERSEQELTACVALGTSIVEAAESCFHQAMDLAHRQHAKSLELRAAMSLSRLWQQQNKHQAAYDLLAPIYDWFTEGFDTADLQDAKTLLDELS